MAPQDDKSPLSMSQYSGKGTADEAKQFLAYLQQREQRPQEIALRRHLCDLLAAKPGDRVVDVGCGMGRLVMDLVERGVSAVGLDSSETGIARAQTRYPSGEFHTASAEALPFRDAKLHGYVAMRLFIHLADAAPALREARRVLAPGGRLVVLEPETDMAAVDTDNPLMVRKMMHAAAEAMANPWVGRALRAHLLAAGFADVRVEVTTLVHNEFTEARTVLSMAAASAVKAAAVTQEEADDWLAEQRRRAEQGRFLFALPHFIVSARRA